jgi:hypothetical protein
MFAIDRRILVGKSPPKVGAATKEIDAFHALALRSGNYETLMLAAQLISTAVVESLQERDGGPDAVSVEHSLSSQIEV